MGVLARAKAVWEIGKGNKASDRGQRAAAAACYRRAMSIADDARCLDESLTARIGLADELFESQQYDECKAELTAVIELSRSENQVSIFNHPTLTWEIRVGAITTMLEIAKTEADSAEADRLVDLLIDESPGPAAAGAARAIAAEHLAGKIEWSAAAQQFASARAEFENAGAIEDQARMAWSEAVAWTRAGSLGDAIVAAQVSERLFDTCGSRDLVGDCVFYQADLLARQGDAAQARSLYERAAEVFRSTANTVQVDNVAMAAWRLECRE